MKIFVLLFSVYFVWLTLQPCTDHADCEAKIIKTEIASQTSPVDSHKDNEPCSPVCSCSYCGAHFIVSNNEFPPASFVYAQHILSITAQYPLKDVYFSFWQPPRIS